jgi:membrane protease YdiL (CAAX protease family)
VSIPTAPLPQEDTSVNANFAPYGPASALQVINPDDPPWGVGAGFLIWLASVFLLLLLQLVAVIPYIVYRYRGTDLQQLGTLITSDTNVLLISILSILPAHCLTLFLVWALVTRFGKRPFWQTIGWSWSPRVGFWTSAGLAVALLIIGGLIAKFIGGQKTPFDEMLESSAANRFAAAFMATATAPLVEELVYRGILYSALQRAIGMWWSVLLVGALFTGVHVAQYYNNLGVIAAVATLGFTLTYVRARTGRILPCIVIHLVFNGIQCVGLVLSYFYPHLLEDKTEQGFVLSQHLFAHALNLIF